MTNITTVQKSSNHFISAIAGTQKFNGVFTWTFAADQWQTNNIQLGSIVTSDILFAMNSLRNNGISPLIYEDLLA